MSIWRYMKDRAGLLLTFAVILGFSFAAVRLGENRALYIVVTGGAAAAVYLALDAYKTISHAGKVKRASEQTGADWTYALPTARTGEQQTYQNAIERYREQAEGRLAAAKEADAQALEYLTLWVHEIKTPIAAARLLLENGLCAPDEGTLYAVGDEIARIEDYVQQSLFYVRAGDFAADYRIDSFSLQRAVENALQNEYAGINGRHLHLILSGLAVTVDSDEKWLTFMIKQLLDNAVKYSPEGGTIRVSAEQRPGETVLTVSDEGAGIRPEDLHRVFQRSFTGGNGRSYYNSTGIGLYLADKLAAKLGHSLTVSSVPGKGAAFTLGLKREDL